MRSDMIALAALVVSIVMTPTAALLSHVFAVRQFRAERLEARVDSVCQTLLELDRNLHHYARLLVTFGGTDVPAALAGTHPLPDPEGLYTKIFEMGVWDDIARNVARLRDLGFEVFLEQQDPIAHDALRNFRRNQETLTPAEKAHFIGECFLKGDVKSRLASISPNDVREFLKSQR